MHDSYLTQGFDSPRLHQFQIVMNINCKIHLKRDDSHKSIDGYIGETTPFQKRIIRSGFTHIITTKLHIVIFLCKAEELAKAGNITESLPTNEIFISDCIDTFKNGTFKLFLEKYSQWENHSPYKIHSIGDFIKVEVEVYRNEDVSHYDIPS